MKVVIVDAMGLNPSEAWADTNDAEAGAVDPDRSVNCYFCGSLADERDCIGADDYNNNDGGSVCKSCAARWTREDDE